MGTGEALRGRIAYATDQSLEGRIAIEHGALHSMACALRNMTCALRNMMCALRNMTCALRDTARAGTIWSAQAHTAARRACIWGMSGALGA